MTVEEFNTTSKGHMKFVERLRYRVSWLFHLLGFVFGSRSLRTIEALYGFKFEVAEDLDGNRYRVVQLTEENLDSLFGYFGDCERFDTFFHPMEIKRVKGVRGIKRHGPPYDRPFAVPGWWFVDKIFESFDTVTKECKLYSPEEFGHDYKLLVGVEVPNAD